MKKLDKLNQKEFQSKSSNFHVRCKNPEVKGHSKRKRSSGIPNTLMVPTRT